MHLSIVYPMNVNIHHRNINHGCQEQLKRSSLRIQKQQEKGKMKFNDMATDDNDFVCYSIFF